MQWTSLLRPYSECMVTWDEAEKVGYPMAANEQIVGRKGR